MNFKIYHKGEKPLSDALKYVYLQLIDQLHKAVNLNNPNNPLAFKVISVMSDDDTLEYKPDDEEEYHPRDYTWIESICSYKPKDSDEIMISIRLEWMDIDGKSYYLKPKVEFERNKPVGLFGVRYTGHFEKIYVEETLADVAGFVDDIVALVTAIDNKGLNALLLDSNSENMEVTGIISRSLQYFYYGSDNQMEMDDCIPLDVISLERKDVTIANKYPLYASDDDSGFNRYDLSVVCAVAPVNVIVSNNENKLSVQADFDHKVANTISKLDKHPFFTNMRIVKMVLNHVIKNKF